MSAPSSARSKTATLDKVESPQPPRVHPETPRVQCRLEQQDSGAHPVHLLPPKTGQECSALLPGPPGQRCSSLHHKWARQWSGGHIRASPFVRQRLLPGWFPGAETLGVEVRYHDFFVARSLQTLPNLLHLTLTKPALNCFRRRLGDCLIIFLSLKVHVQMWILF